MLESGVKTGAQMVPSCLQFRMNPGARAKQGAERADHAFPRVRTQALALAFRKPGVWAPQFP